MEFIAALISIVSILSLLRLFELKKQNKLLKKISESQVPIIDLAELFLNMAIHELGRVKEDVDDLKKKSNK